MPPATDRAWRCPVLRVENQPVPGDKGVAWDSGNRGKCYQGAGLFADSRKPRRAGLWRHLCGGEPDGPASDFYKDGEKVLESDFVSGNVSRGHTTPPGIFSITYKQRDAVLKGEGYASPVKFWMPFNGGIGFHDASWRSSFGGSIYKSGGSHGCVNMPYDKAKELLIMCMRGCPLSAMTFRVQRAGNPASLQAGRLRRLRLRSRYRHRQRRRPPRHRRSKIRVFRRGHCHPRQYRRRQRRSHHSLRLSYSLRTRQPQRRQSRSRHPEPQKGTDRPFRHHSPAHQPGRASADGTH